MNHFILAPSKTASDPSETSFPTVFPDPPIYQHATKVGNRTLWVIFVLMVLSVIAFAAMAWAVPAVRL
jgi:hypothetical protein